MHQRLVAEASELAEKMSVEIADKKHRLEEQDAGCPYGRRSTEQWQHHLSNHGLTTEKEECAEEKRQGEQPRQFHAGTFITGGGFT
jgi:hypothetical protein